MTRPLPPPNGSDHSLEANEHISIITRPRFSWDAIAVDDGPAGPTPGSSSSTTDLDALLSAHGARFCSPSG
jgi:hypothetical protein